MDSDIKVLYKEIDCLIPSLVYMYKLRHNKEAMAALDRLFLTFLYENILCKNTDSYSLGEKVEEVSDSANDEHDLLSLHGIPLHLVSLTFDDDDFEVDNKFLKPVPKLKKILTELRTYAEEDWEAKDAVRQIILELEKVNITY